MSRDASEVREAGVAFGARHVAGDAVESRQERRAARSEDDVPESFS